MATKFGQFLKLKCREWSQLCELSQLCYHFLSSFDIENNFCWYLKLFPAHRRPEFIHQSILPKKLTFLYIFKKKSINRDIHLGNSWPYICKVWTRAHISRFQKAVTKLTLCSGIHENKHQHMKGLYLVKWLPGLVLASKQMIFRFLEII